MSRALFSLFIASSLFAQSAPENSTPTAEKPAPAEPPAPLTYEDLKAWHRAGGLASHHWPREHSADLNEDGINEVLLAISGSNRGMLYALFTKQAERWVLLSDTIDASDHPIEVLPEKKRQWHNFVTVVPSGRGGLHKITYSWNGKKYFRYITAGVPIESK